MLETATAASTVVGSALNAGEGIGRVELKDSPASATEHCKALADHRINANVRGCCCTLVSWGWLSLLV